jgi:peptide/nickel transport system ATP-binding protein
MGAIPALDSDVERLAQIPGSMPRLTAIPKGCAFNPRCDKAFERCLIERPNPITVGSRQIACWLYDSERTEAAA